MNRVIFLDIDGVLVTGESIKTFRSAGLSAYDASHTMDVYKLGYVMGIAEQTGSKVVVSSTWRYDAETKDILGSLPLHKDWRTPRAQPNTKGIYLADSRGIEIQQWLDAHPDVESYVIIDDDSDMLSHQRIRHVKTDFETGLTLELAERAMLILNGGIQ